MAGAGLVWMSEYLMCELKFWLSMGNGIIPKSQPIMFLFLPFLLLVLACEEPQRGDAQLTGPYLGQTLPGDNAVMFTHEHISAGRSEGTGIFSPDGMNGALYVSRIEEELRPPLF